MISVPIIFYQTSFIYTSVVGIAEGEATIALLPLFQGQVADAYRKRSPDDVIASFAYLRFCHCSFAYPIDMKKECFHIKKKDYVYRISFTWGSWVISYFACAPL